MNRPHSLFFSHIPRPHFLGLRPMPFSYPGPFFYADALSDSCRRATLAHPRFCVDAGVQGGEIRVISLSGFLSLYTTLL